LGNVYVTGISYGSGTGYDYATIKYDPNGNELWVERYNGPDNSWDSARAMTLDDNDNIYVTGSSYSATSVDYATIKYDTDGNELWVARYNGPGNSGDYARAVAIDSSGYVYVTGHSYSGTSDDYITIKYSPDSNIPLWVVMYSGPENSDDLPCAIAADSNNNIYVTGSEVYWESEYSGYATIKYDTDGNELWVARYGSLSDDFYGLPKAIAVDSNDNIYVTGYSRSGTGSVYAAYTIIKYSPDSNEPLWVVTYSEGDNNNYAEAIAVDSNENVYVTGRNLYYGTGGGLSDYLTIKYSQPRLTGDINSDCKVNFYDLKILCQSWLECNLEPPEACW